MAGGSGGVGRSLEQLIRGGNRCSRPLLWREVLSLAGCDRGEGDGAEKMFVGSFPDFL